MTAEILVQQIRKIIIVQKIERYFNILQNADNEPFVNGNWQKIQHLYETIDESNKANLKVFVEMAVTETITDLLAFIDDQTRFENQEYSLELRYNEQKISGTIQEYLLMDIEDNKQL